jgi:hypothetical protein
LPKIDYKKLTLARIDAFIFQIKHLQGQDFPYPASSEALEKILKHIKTQRTLVDRTLLTNEGVHEVYTTATDQLFIFQKYLGYISNSSNPQNSFETYFLFRRLAVDILGRNLKLIISSEWEYSPSNFDTRLELNEFVFIGLPISEVNNALIVPLGGHELGHSVWKAKKLKSKYFNTAQTLIKEKNYSFIDNNDHKKIGSIAETAIKKCTEYFCDFVGIGLFGESYLFAFAYLLAPKRVTTYNHRYPQEDKRATAMSKAIEIFGFNLPENFNQLFSVHLKEPENNLEKYLSAAEEVAYELIETLILETKTLLESKDVFYKRAPNHNEIKAELISGVPTSLANSMADITNAAWDIYFTEDAWPLLVDEGEKTEFLNRAC